MRLRLETQSGVEYFRIDNDTNGNPRYVIHYLEIPYQDDLALPYDINQDRHIAHAAHVLGGRRYRANWFGGGIVFSSYNVEELLEKVTKK